MLFPQVFDADFYSRVAALQHELGFACTVHLPFLWLDLASLNERVRRAGVDCVRQAVELTEPLQVATYVLHLWGPTTVQIYRSLEHPQQRQAVLDGLLVQAGRSVVDVCEFLAPRDVCVENLETPPFEFALPLVEQHEVSICLDVGHLAWQGTGALQLLAQYRDRIREIHLHDAMRTPSGEVHDHRALGQGELDCTTLLSELVRSGYEGAVILEVNTRSDLEQSLNYLEPLLPYEYPTLG